MPDIDMETTSANSCTLSDVFRMCFWFIIIFSCVDFTQAGPYQSDMHFAQRLLIECDPELLILIVFSGLLV